MAVPSSNYAGKGICVVTDECHAAHAATALASAVLFSPGLCGFVIGRALSNDTQEKFGQLAASLNAEISVLDATHIDLSRFGGFLGAWSEAVWLKLFLADLIPENCQRIVYIDTDTVCLSPLAPLFDMDLDDSILAAVPDPPKWVAERRAALGIPETHTYFNTGVLLIDACGWRELALGEKAADYAAKHINDRKLLAYVDQCAINKVAWDHAARLGSEWNVMVNSLPLTELDILPRARILHFTLRKPWSNSNLPGAAIYWRFRNMTPWKIERSNGRPAILTHLAIRCRYMFESMKILLYSAVGQNRRLDRARLRQENIVRGLAVLHAEHEYMDRISALDRFR